MQSPVHAQTFNGKTTTCRRPHSSPETLSANNSWPVRTWANRYLLSAARRITPMFQNRSTHSITVVCTHVVALHQAKGGGLDFDEGDSQEFTWDEAMAGAAALRVSSPVDPNNPRPASRRFRCSTACFSLCARWLKANRLTLVSRTRVPTPLFRARATHLILCFGGDYSRCCVWL